MLVLSVMIMVGGLALTRGHLRTLARPAMDVPRSARLLAAAAVSAWLLLLLTAWLSALTANMTLTLIGMLLWIFLPLALALVSVRSKRAEQREEDLLRAGQALPTRRHLAAPWQVALAWGAVYAASIIAATLAPALWVTPGHVAHFHPGLLYLACLPLLAGAAHTAVQHHRVGQEVSRAAAADRYIVGLSTDGKPSAG